MGVERAVGQVATGNAPCSPEFALPSRWRLFEERQILVTMAGPGARVALVVGARDVPL